MTKMHIVTNNIQLGQQYQAVVDFLTKGTCPPPRIDICNLEHRYSHGGLHAARCNYRVKENTERKILDIDFTSFYPFIMLYYVPWFYSGMSRARYEKIVTARIKAKINGDTATADKLKKVIDPAFGLAYKKNPELGAMICAAGQLIITDLLDKVSLIPSVNLINTNTDGIILSYASTREESLLNTVETFKNRIQIPITYQVIHEIYQQDVSNFVAELGESYTIQDGERLLLKPDEHKFKVAGQTCPQIVATAIASYLLKNIPIDTTVNTCSDLAAFRLKVVRVQLACAGYRYYNGKNWLKLPDTFDAYSVNNPSYGSIYALSYDKKLSRLPGISWHSIADTKGLMRLDLLDKEFYINEANRYIDSWNKKKTRHERT